MCLLSCLRDGLPRGGLNQALNARQGRSWEEEGAMGTIFPFVQIA
jgi:hypothetical protein